MALVTTVSMIHDSRLGSNSPDQEIPCYQGTQTSANAPIFSQFSNLFHIFRSYFCMVRFTVILPHRRPVPPKRLLPWDLKQKLCVHFLFSHKVRNITLEMKYIFWGPNPQTYTFFWGVTSSHSTLRCSGWHTCFVFWRFTVRISTWRLAILRYFVVLLSSSRQVLELSNSESSLIKTLVTHHQSVLFKNCCPSINQTPDFGFQSASRQQEVRQRQWLVLNLGG